MAVTESGIITNDLLMLVNSVNTFTYVTNNPVMYFDLLGLDRYDICKDRSALGEAICRGCVGAVCGLPGVDSICCKVDFDDCVAESNGDQQKMKICAAQFNACNLKKSKKLPSGPKDGEISNDNCGDSERGCQ